METLLPLYVIKRRHFNESERERFILSILLKSMVFFVRLAIFMAIILCSGSISIYLLTHALAGCLYNTTP